MADLCRVLLVGNVRDDLARHVREDGMVFGVMTICAGRTQLLGGQPVLETVAILAEVIGATRVASVAQQFGAGSRVLIEGHLEQRAATRMERLPRADGAGAVLVRVARSELVLVIDTIFNAAPLVPTVDAQRQPAQLPWQEP